MPVKARGGPPVYVTTKFLIDSLIEVKLAEQGCRAADVRIDEVAALAGAADGYWPGIVTVCQGLVDSHLGAAAARPSAERMATVLRISKADTAAALFGALSMYVEARIGLARARRAVPRQAVSAAGANLADAFRGAYDTSATYTRGQLVMSDGSTWLALTSGTLPKPGDGPAWRLFARAGRDGRDRSRSTPHTNHGA
jgi:hypothetical protein